MAKYVLCFVIWICYCIYYKEYDEIAYPFPNFNGVAVEDWLIFPPYNLGGFD